MKLYWADVLNPRKVCAVAKHIGAPVEYVHVELTKGEHASPAFRARNPNAKLPVLVDGDTVLWESDAIMVHLAFHARSDLWPRDARQIEVVRWMSWNQAHFNRWAGTLFFENVVKPRFGMGALDATKVAEASRQFAVFARVLDAHLDGRDWLVDGALSLADFAVSATLPWAEPARLPLQAFPAIRAWHERLLTIPAWRDPYPEGGTTGSSAAG